MDFKQEILPLFAALGMSVIFGFSFIFTRGALEYIDPIHFLAFRFFLAAVLVNILRFTGIIKVRKGSFKPLLLLGIFQPILYFVCETIGIKLTSASEGGMMVALIPIFTVTMAYYFLKEKPHPRQVFFIILSVAGVLLITTMQLGQEAGRNFFGLLILLGAPISGGAFTILSRRLSTSFTPLEMTYAMMNLGFLFFAGLSLGQHLWQDNISSFLLPLYEPAVLQAVLYLATLSSVVAFFLVNFALSLLPATRLSVFPSLTTLIAVVAGITILGENLYWFHFLGALKIILGVWGTNYYSSLLTVRKIE